MAEFSPDTQLDELDEIALAILTEGDRMMRENLTGKARDRGTLMTDDPTLRCVAVADANGTLLIAANNFFKHAQIRISVSRRTADWHHKMSKKNINKTDPLADDWKTMFDIFSDTSEDARKLGYDGAIFVTGAHTYLNNYHAEMQIIQFMLDHKIKPERRYMGVSKPCCPECYAILDSAGFRYAERHSTAVAAVRNVSGKFSHPIFVQDSLSARFGSVSHTPLGNRESPR